MGVGAEEKLSIVEAQLTADTTCRCGSKIRRGAPALEVRGGPRDVAEIFRGVSFSSSLCLHAFLLEELETLANSATQEADEISAGIRELYWQVDSSLRGSIDGYFATLNRATS